MRHLLCILWYGIIFFSITHCTSPNHKQLINLDTNWSLHNISGLDIHIDSLTIPSTVHSALLPQIPHPFKASNEDSLQWISQQDWTYRTSFSIDDYQLNKDHIELHLEGIDTYAHILLNDHDILSTDNAFIHWKKDIKSLLKTQNTIEIRLHAPDSIEQQKAASHPYQLPEGNRIYTRKAQFQYGWDWGPQLNTMGILKPIYIYAYNDFKINDVYLKQNHINDSIANITAQITLSHPITDSLTYEVHINDKRHDHSTTQPLINKSTTAYQELHFEIKDPKLWWPHNLGEPYLYDINIKVLRQDKVIDQHHIKKGIRTARLITQPDQHGSSFYVEINGTPVYIKGANYIPQNSMQDLVTTQDYDRLLDDVVTANMNMLRVWGGGIYENDLFYEKCDEKGILVWQDFMFACAMYPGDDRFRKSVKKEATQQLTRLRNHSSIVLWCGNNESREGWHRWGWQEGRPQAQRDSIWNDYRSIFQIDLPKYVAQMTKEPYWESSPHYGRGNPKYEFHGDAHDWRVWHDAYPFEHFKNHVPRFMSEFGFQAHPSYQTIKYINSSGKIDLHTPDYATHQKHTRGNELIDTYMQRYFPVPEQDDDYVYISQLVQAYGMSMGIQAHRRARPYNMGTLYWQLNDCWPAVSWSSIDYLGNWKALHYQVQRDFKNTIISNTVKNDSLHSYVVNDLLTTQVEDFDLWIKDFKGSVLFHFNLDSSIAFANNSASTKIHTLDLRTLNIDPNQAYVVSRFGKHENISFLSKPKDLVLQQPKISLSTLAIDKGYQVTVKSNTLVKDLFLYTDTEGHFEDNFFNLEPGKEKTILFTTSSKNLPNIQWKCVNHFTSQ